MSAANLQRRVRTVTDTDRDLVSGTRSDRAAAGDDNSWEPQARWKQSAAVTTILRNLVHAQAVGPASDETSWYFADTPSETSQGGEECVVASTIPLVSSWVILLGYMKQVRESLAKRIGWGDLAAVRAGGIVSDISTASTE